MSDKLAVFIGIGLLWMAVTMTSAQPPIECDTELLSRFVPAASGEVIAADGLALYADPTTESQALANLDAGTPMTAWFGGLCREDGLWWFVETEFIMGWLPEITLDTENYLIAPIRLPETDDFSPRAGDDPPPTEEEGLQFTLSANIAMNSEVNWVLANTDLYNPQIFAHPTHRSITFEGSLGNLQPEGYLRYLRVHPAAQWEAITQISLDELRTQLDERPTEPYLTGLPWVGAARFINADPAYVNFQNGIGIRALVQYTQSGSPVVDGELLYQFVGLTDDREYLVHAAFALDSSLISADADRDTDFNFNAYVEYQIFSDHAFQDNLSVLLSTAPDNTFTPRLSDVDTFIKSLRVDTVEWCGETPSLLSVGDTVQQRLDVPLRVRDSANGRVIINFLPDEEAVIVDGPECVNGVVWWNAFRVNHWSGWVAELEGETYYLTEVNES